MYDHHDNTLYLSCYGIGLSVAPTEHVLLRQVNQMIECQTHLFFSRASYAIGAPVLPPVARLNKNIPLPTATWLSETQLSQNIKLSMGRKTGTPNCLRITAHTYISICRVVIRSSCFNTDNKRKQPNKTSCPHLLRKQIHYFL